MIQYIVKQEDFSREEEKIQVQIKNLKLIHSISNINKSIIKYLRSSDIKNSIQSFKNMWEAVSSFLTKEDMNRRDISFESSPVYKSLPNIFKSIRKELINREKDISEIVKKQFWESFCENIDDNDEEYESKLNDFFSDINEIFTIDTLVNNITENIRDMMKKINYERILLIVHKFEVFLSKKDINEYKDVYKFIEDIKKGGDDQFISQSLIRVREIIRDDDHESIEVSETQINVRFHPPNESSFLPDDLWLLPKCHYRKSTIEIIEMIKKLLNDANNQSKPGILRIYDAVNDILEMYLTLVPSYLGTKLESSPKLTMLLYNDMKYFIYQLSRFSILYKPIFSTCIPSFSFEQFIPRFQLLQIKVYDQQIKRIIEDVYDILVQGGIFNIDNEDSFKKAEDSLKVLSYRVKSMATTCQSILDDKSYHKWMGTIIQSIAAYFNKNILSTEDFSLEESENLYNLLTQLYPLEDLIFDKEYQELNMKTWIKFKLMVEIFNMKMVKIVESYRSGNMTVLSGDEVIHLIKALFADSATRKAQINLIKSTTE